MTELEKTKEELERLRVQLAGCGVAALGGVKDHTVVKKGDYGWSSAYQDVLDLRLKYDRMVSFLTLASFDDDDAKMKLEGIASENEEA